MKKLIFTFSLIFAISTFCHSQVIESEKVFDGYKYTLNGENLNMEELSTQLNTNEESVKLVKQAKSQNTIATILGGAGGALVGYSIGTAIGGGEANLVVVGVGAGIIAVAIPVAAGAGKKMKRAVDVHNSRINTKENLAFKQKLLTISNKNGLGLAFQF